MEYDLFVSQFVERTGLSATKLYRYLSLRTLLLSIVTSINVTEINDVTET